MNQMFLVRNGRARATIDISGDPERLAPVAAELQRCVRAATDAALPVVLAPPPDGHPAVRLIIEPDLLDRFTRRNPAPREAVSWTCNGRDSLSISGSDAEALWLALYAFLEAHAGCHWFFPGPDGEDIPRSRSLAVPRLRVVHAPSFIIRDWRHWPREFQRQKLGGALTLGPAHSYARVVPADELRRHPAYGVLIGGRRSPNPGFQRCLGQRGVEDLAVRYCLEFFRAHPEAPLVDLSPNDCEVFCDCPRCIEANLGHKPQGAERRASPYWVTRSVFDFANRVAERVGREFPGKLVVVIAYSRTKSPPRNLRIRDNVLVWYCDQPQENWQGAAGRAQMDREIAQWTRIARHVGVFDYVVNQSWPGLTRPITGLLAHELQHLHRCGGRYYYTQHAEDFGVNLPNYHLLATLLWDVRRDPAKVLDDFYRRCFRSGAQAVERYYDVLAAAIAAAAAPDAGPGTLGITAHRRGHEGVCAVYTPAVMRAAGEALRQARRDTAGDPQARRRLRLVEGAFTHLRTAVEAARLTFAFEHRYRIPTLAPWAWNVGNYDYPSAVEKLQMFGRPCADQFRGVMEAWRQYRAVRRQFEGTGAIAAGFSKGGRSFDALDTLQNIWDLYTGQKTRIPPLVKAKPVMRAM